MRLANKNCGLERRKAFLFLKVTGYLISLLFSYIFDILKFIFLFSYKQMENWKVNFLLKNFGYILVASVLQLFKNSDVTVGTESDYICMLISKLKVGPKGYNRNGVLRT